MTKNLYIFSGLGVDERVFQNLDFSEYSVTYIKWIAPLDNESMEAYAARISEQITTEDPVLIGLSFGGMMAVEVSKLIESEKVILIASAKTRKEIPWYFRLVGKMHIHKIVPAALLKHPTFLTNWFFGATTPLEKQLLKQILSETDSKFLKWALNEIVHWKNQTPPENVYHVHGTLDRILPASLVTCDKKINGGGHFMTLNKVEELDRMFKQLLT